MNFTSSNKNLYLLEVRFIINIIPIKWKESTLNSRYSVCQRETETSVLYGNIGSSSCGRHQPKRKSPRAMGIQINSGVRLEEKEKHRYSNIF